MSNKTAVLLINLGTPQNTSKTAIKSYLREFLLDRRVIDLPWPLRFLLVNFAIIPFRYKSSMHAYKSIWTDNGSPLLVNSRNLQQKLRLQLNPNTPQSKQENLFDVWLAMRYGQPSLPDVLAQLQQNNYTRIIIVPLYPQYASASTGSVIEKCLKHLSDFRYFPKIVCLNEFYNHPRYIASVGTVIQDHVNLAAVQSDPECHILFSYHGIPKRQLKLTNNAQTMCSDNKSCPLKDSGQTKNNKCYRAQCYSTSYLIAKHLDLNSKKYSTSFQSRLGKLPWVKPYTDEVLQNLRSKGISKLYVVTPSFVADCLETLEEIGMRLKEDWIALGGQEFNLIPCLNDDDNWAHSLAEIISSDCL